MVGYRAVLISAGDSGGDDVVERLAAVAPRRVHLKIAPIRIEARSAKLCIAKRSNDLRACEKVGAELTARGDVRGAAARRDRTLDGLRSPRAKHLENDPRRRGTDRKSTRLNSSHGSISYAVFCLKKK